MSVLKQFEHLRIRLEVIESATNNFAEENCIGRGGFGKVYKGELLDLNGHTMVAFKRLDRAFGQGDSEFWKEVMLLSVYSHQNIISLLGFCDEKEEKILVYEYASRRSLDLHLDNKDLTWVQRLKVCIDAACGLAYLHHPGETQQRVLHRDIKSSNILLDENWNARIADLGLSRYGPANQKYTFIVTNNTVGTIGYCDPLYLESGILTKESDVYSFGVVLFEVLCGRLCFVQSGSFTQLVRKHYKQNSLNEIVWDNIKDEIDPSSLKAFSTIAYQCLKSDNEKRPLMHDIVRGLETALQYQLPTALVLTTDTSQPGFENLKPGKVDLREHARRHDHDKWVKFRDTNEENLIDYQEHDEWSETHEVGEENLDKRGDMYKKRHICANLVKRVPLFKNMNERLLDDICQRLKPRIYTRDSYIIREGYPLDAMLFIISGRVESTTTNHFFSNSFLYKGDFCGDELLTWALDPDSGANVPSSTRTLKVVPKLLIWTLDPESSANVPSSSRTLKGMSKLLVWAPDPKSDVNLPSSTRTFSALRDVKAFALPANDLKFIVVHFKGINSIQVWLTVKFYSKRWRVWATCFIQAAWRTYSMRKISDTHNHGSQKKIFIKLRKPQHPNFTHDTDYKMVLHTSGIFSRESAARAIQVAWRRYFRRNRRKEEAHNIGTSGTSYSFGATAWGLLELMP